MGIYDRDYYGQDQSTYRVQRPQSIITTLIVINVAFYLAHNILTPGGEGGINAILALRVDTIYHPLQWYQFLTYGFVHAAWPDIWHILGNMLGLFFLGPWVEARYGRREFTILYLVFIVAGGIVWSVSSAAAGVPDWVRCVGASGAIVGIVVLFALNFPRQILYIWGVLPVPAWVLGILVVVMDLQGAIQQSGNVAYAVHLTGAAIAFLYFQSGWRFESLVDKVKRPQLRRGPKLRVRDPDDQRGSNSTNRRDRKAERLASEVDRLLEKISREGESSLTPKERETLQTASREYKDKHRK